MVVRFDAGCLVLVFIVICGFVSWNCWLVGYVWCLLFGWFAVIMVVFGGCGSLIVCFAGSCGLLIVCFVAGFV